MVPLPRSTVIRQTLTMDINKQAKGDKLPQKKPTLNAAQDKEVYTNNERSPLDPDPFTVPSYRNQSPIAYKNRGE